MKWHLHIEDGGTTPQKKKQNRDREREISKQQVRTLSEANISFSSLHYSGGDY